MKKYIIGAIIGVLSVLGFTAFAEGNLNLPFRDLGYFDAVNMNVIKFVDPDNGNVCYLAAGVYKGGISCLKNN